MREVGVNDDASVAMEQGEATSIFLPFRGKTADGSLGIIVSVAERPDEIRNLIPEMIDGIPIEIVTTGRLRAF